MSSRQRELVFRSWGGKRAGAGRKPAGERRRVPHVRRAIVNPRHPILVTVRVTPEIARLRTKAMYRAIRDALTTVWKRAYEPEAFRICHLSIQGNHLHILVEADSNEALSRGMKGFLVSCARRLNAVADRRGRVFADRFHSSTLATPRQVRNALGYLLNNWRKHGDARTGLRLDPYSSAFALPDWSRGPVSFRDVPEPLPVAIPRTWLLAEGWRRAGSISPWARPGAA
jgi:putative transposase